MNCKFRVNRGNGRGWPSRRAKAENRLHEQEEFVIMNKNIFFGRRRKENSKDTYREAAEATKRIYCDCCNYQRGSDRFGRRAGRHIEGACRSTYPKAVFSAIGLCLAVMAIQGAIQTENSTAHGVVHRHRRGRWDGVGYRRPDAVLRPLAAEPHESRRRFELCQAFVTLSVMQVVGAMAILGPYSGSSFRRYDALIFEIYH